MSKTQRNVTLGLWGLMVVSLLSLIAMMKWQSRVDAARAQEMSVAATSPAATQPDSIESFGLEAPSFKLTDQQGQAFDSASLRGKVWTASFFFSRCQGVCPGMMERMHELQRAVTDPNVHNVYLTVDPERDTPERLAEYAKEANADASHWHMLTGPSAEMKRIAFAFGKPYETPAMHSAAIILVNRDGKIVGFYESRHPEEMLRLAQDMKRVLGETTITVTAEAKS